LLTAEEGILKATVFGGAKSKLRAHSAPYNSGQVWIYRDPAKDYAKLSDFDVQSWRPGLRELYERTMAAGGIAETILSTHGGGGDWGTAMKLAVSTLDALEDANEELCSRLLVHFLWRWAEFLGLQPDLDNCSVCGAGAPKEPHTAARRHGGHGEELSIEKNNLLWFNSRENAVFCESCIGEQRGSLIQLNAGCRRWLSVVRALEPSQLHRYSMDSKCFSEAKALTAAIMTGALGKRLAIWDW
jgi:DNA repair protein RecO (recombination protein O)